MVDADPDIRPCPDTTGHRAGVGEMKEPKCCGNCRWWRKKPRQFFWSRLFGYCTWAKVDPGKVGVIATSHNSGQQCPCHEMKGSGDEQEC
jgi:hypothetical protein